jgi:hypothetical protein
VAATAGTLVVSSPTGLKDGCNLVVGGGAAGLFNTIAALAPTGDLTPSTAAVSAATTGCAPQSADVAAADGTALPALNSVPKMAAPVSATIPAAAVSRSAAVGVGGVATSGGSGFVANRDSAAKALLMARIRDVSNQAAFVPQYGSNRPWLQTDWNEFAFGSSDNERVSSVQAFDAVLAEYGQQ